MNECIVIINHQAGGTRNERDTRMKRSKRYVRSLLTCYEQTILCNHNNNNILINEKAENL
jgi:hypothetical protein